MSHEPNEPKDDEAGKEAGHAVAAADHDGVAEYVVLELVVAGQGDHAAPGDAEREEDLDASVRPHLMSERVYSGAGETEARRTRALPEFRSGLENPLWDELKQSLAPARRLRWKGTEKGKLEEDRIFYRSLRLNIFPLVDSWKAICR